MCPIQLFNNVDCVDVGAEPFMGRAAASRPGCAILPAPKRSPCKRKVRGLNPRSSYRFWITALAEVLDSGLALIPVGYDRKRGTAMCLAGDRTRSPQASPASRVLDASGIAVKRHAVHEHIVVWARGTNVVSRERQRIVQACEFRRQVRMCRVSGCWRAANVLAFRQVAGG